MIIKISTTATPSYTHTAQNANSKVKSVKELLIAHSMKFKDVLLLCVGWSYPFFFDDAEIAQIDLFMIEIVDSKQITS
jgi:hypothetical protein